MNPPDPAAPLTTEQLCSNLLAIKPGDAFECRSLSARIRGWNLVTSDMSPLQVVREGYDVRPLPSKRFVLLYHCPRTLQDEYDGQVNRVVSGIDALPVWIRAYHVESSSLSAAAALAAPQPGETFLAAVPYPEAS